MNRKSSWLPALALLGALCWSAAPAEAQVKLSLQTGATAPGIYLANLFVAQHAGFFRDEGVEVEIRYTAGGPLATQIVASGGADLGDVTFEGLLLGYDKGI